MNWIYGRWWKWVCVVLLIYVAAGSFFVPLGPGITRVAPVSFYPDSVYTFQISAYHSHFLSPEAGKGQRWFKNRNQYYLPVSFKITGNETAEAQFAVGSAQQGNFKPANFDVVMNDELDGTFALRDAITLVHSEISDTAFNYRIVAAEPEVKNNKHRLFCFPYREILYETIRNTF